MNVRRWMLPSLCLAIAAVAFTAGLLIRPEKQNPQRQPQALVSKEALSTLLNTQFNDYDGKSHPFSQWKGKVLVINFWATWCAPCREEMPYFSRIGAKYAVNGIQFIGISTDTPETVRRFAQQHGVSYPLLIGGPQIIALSTELGNRQSGLPFTLILDRNGEPLLTRTGRLPEAELENFLKSAATP